MDVSMVEPDILLEELVTSLEMDLSYSSEKLVNLDLFMAIVSLGENELQEFPMESETISQVRVGKALAFDLSFGYLDSEVTELGNFLNLLQTKIYDAYQKIYLRRQRRDIFDALIGKLHVSESCWKHLQEQLSEMKKQLANLHRTISTIRPESTCSLEDEDLEGSGLRLQTAEQQILVLKRLEKSLAAELEFEKQLLELTEREELLRSKLLITNDILSKSEASSEVVLERLLEAEISSEIFVGIAKEMMSRVQILQFSLHCSFQREEQLKSQLFRAKEVTSEMEARSEVALERLLVAEDSADIFTGIAKEMMSHLQVLHFNQHCLARREHELKSKLLLTNEAVSEMETFSEVALDRLLEAEHSAEIFMGISKEMMSRLQILQFNLHCSVQREHGLKSKFLLTNEVVSNLEEFSEIALERLLEAEHSAEIFKGIAKEMMSRLQMLHFNLHCSIQREGELRLKLQGTLEKAENKHAEMKQSFDEKQTLMEEKVEALEEKLQSSDLKLRETKAAYEASKEQVSMLENAVESLREEVFMAENRAHEAEAKLSTLTEDGDNDSEKVSLLEKQVRDLEMQVQNARVSSEASLEQQNMLYTAIWDMETLIEELKSKFAKAETKTESLEETNQKLRKEISRLKAENNKLKGSLKEANGTKVGRVKEMNNVAKLVTDMVMQLGIERERIKNQLSCLAGENKILMDELQKTRKNAKQDDIHYKEKESRYTVDDDPATHRNQVVEEAREEMIRDDDEAEDNSTSEAAASNFTNHENGRFKVGNKISYLFATILVVVFSILAMSFNWPNAFSSITHKFLLL